MKSSAEIRKENKKKIYKYMLNGEHYTKQQISVATGLSVATCNTLLNDMELQGIVTGEKKLLQEVGRSSVLYKVNDNHESYLVIHFYVDQGDKIVETILFSPTGKFINRSKKKYEWINYEQVEKIINNEILENPNISQIIVGTPSIAENGVIKYCDIEELNHEPLKEKLENRFKLSVAIENDMYFKAYGYYKKYGNSEEVITLAYFPSNILPGTATIHKGNIIKGANSFAGMTGFLPYDISKKEQLEMLTPEYCIPFITKSITAIIVLLNPSSIILTGNLIEEKMLENIREKCLVDIPEEYMPTFLVVDSFDEYYYEGMYQFALDRKGY